MGLDNRSLVVFRTSVLSRSVHPGDHASTIRMSELRETRFSGQEVETGTVEPVNAIRNLLDLVLQRSPAISHVPGMLLSD